MNPLPNRGNLIFIVAYNHERLLPKVAARIPREILDDPNNELLIIDDGSQDGTFFAGQGIRDTLAAKAKVTVLKNPVNQGYGGNQKIGYRYAIDRGYQHVYLVHGDGQYAPELLPQFIEAYSGGQRPDAVFGTRMQSWKQALKGGMPVYKLLGNIVLTFTQNRLLKLNMSEFHSGYRTYSTSLLRRIPFERNSNDFHFDTEIIIQILAAGGKIHEMAIPTHYGDEVCNVNGIQYAFNVLKSSLHFRLQKMGFLYDRKFDVGAYQYQEKRSPFSSHSMIISHVKKGSKVLDIGCGDGIIANRLISEKECDVYGLDLLPDEQAPKSLKKYWMIDFNKDFSPLGVALRAAQYDYIILGDVIEHLVDPEGFLDFIRAHSPVNPAPKLLVSTGNVAFFIVRLMLLLGQFNYAPKGILDRTHCRLFTRKSMRNIFNQCGYKVESFRSIPLPFSSIFGDSRLAQTLEGLNVWLCKIAEGFFSYQFLLTAEPLPTVVQLLADSEEYSSRIQDQKGTYELNNA